MNKMTLKLLLHLFGFKTFRGSFLVQFLDFENLEIVFRNKMSTFGGVCFLQLFDWSTPYRCFCWFSSIFH